MGYINGMDANDREIPDSYYQASRCYAIDARRLRTTRRVDVAVIGGGLTGVSSALRLANGGAKVAVLESRDFGWGASGRSGGQIIAGFSADQDKVEKYAGIDLARELWAHSIAAVEWTWAQVAKYQIKCDAQRGYLHVAVSKRQARELREWALNLRDDYGYRGLDYLDRAKLQKVLASEMYNGAVFDPNSGHLHPLNYCLGMTQAAQAAGAELYRDSAVIEVGHATSKSNGANATKGANRANGDIVVRTAHGAIHCGQVIYGCNAYIDKLQPRLAKAIMPVATCIVATEPLDAAFAKSLIANRAAVADTNFVLDYYRLSADNRMLFGGRVGYAALEPRRLSAALRRRMVRVFPQLHNARIDFTWGGYVAITRNRIPQLGRLHGNGHGNGGRAWFAHGYSGHGMALSGYVGKLLADAALGDARAVESFAQIRHRNFPGGAALRTPMLMAAMSWVRLCEKIRYWA